MTLCIAAATLALATGPASANAPPPLPRDRIYRVQASDNPTPAIVGAGMAAFGLLAAFVGARHLAGPTRRVVLAAAAVLALPGFTFAGVWWSSNGSVSPGSSAEENARKIEAERRVLQWSGPVPPPRRSGGVD